MSTTTASPSRTELSASLRSLPSSARMLADRIMGATPSLWLPLAGPQMRAYLSDADELYYGGAAGGGKTDLLIGLAITAHRQSIIFRREYPQLKGIIQRSRDIVGDGGHYNANEHVWRIADGRLLEFGAAQHSGDEKSFQGRPHDLKAFDELPNFLESQYRFLIGWNRTTIPGQRCRVVSAGNPPTNAEGEWVIRYWGPWLDPQHPNPAAPGELRWFAVLDGEDVEQEGGAPFDWKGETIYPRSRTFIPARLGDNPYLLKTGYMGTLQGMPEPLRSQMLYGDFSAGLDDDPWQVIPTAWIRAAQQRWRDALGQPLPAFSCVGVDVARGGSDQTVLARRHGPWFAPLEKHAGKDTPDGPAVAGLVQAALAAGGGGYANVDVIGVGSSVYDSLVQQGVSAIPVNFATSSGRRDRSGVLTFTNLRAWAYWSLREALDPEKGDGLLLPPDSQLLADLCAPRWQMRASGVQVEAKEDIVKRLGRSPDCGDAVALAFLTTPTQWVF